MWDQGPTPVAGRASSTKSQLRLGLSPLLPGPRTPACEDALLLRSAPPPREDAPLKELSRKRDGGWAQPPDLFVRAPSAPRTAPAGRTLRIRDHLTPNRYVLD